MIVEFSLVAPPVDLIPLIKARGLKLVREEVRGSVSGRLYPKTREIFVNTYSRSIARQRFTAAHELGHWELRHYQEEDLPPDSQGFEGAYESGAGWEGRSAIEIEANAFAAELLMPGNWLKREVRPLKPGRADVLAAEYRVSRQAMFYQLMQYNMF